MVIRHGARATVVVEGLCGGNSGVINTLDGRRTGSTSRGWLQYWPCGFKSRQSHLLLLSKENE